MGVLITMAVFGGVMIMINRVLRYKEIAGDFDPLSPSSAARPGLRLLFDFSRDGWRGDGVGQLPPRREQMS